ncbi:hypothetical protein ACVIJ6_000042 [Bradyrhizobium sp. USDA 4369]
MLMRTPAREKPGLGARWRRAVERLRDLTTFARSSFTRSSFSGSSFDHSSPPRSSLARPSLASSPLPPTAVVEPALDISDESNFDVALAAIVDSIERQPRSTQPRFAGQPRLAPPGSEPATAWADERPPYLPMERPVGTYPYQSYSPAAASLRGDQEDELQQLRKELMHAVSARLGSPEDHLATIRTLLRSVK